MSASDGDRVKVPPDVDVADRLVGGLTMRQLGCLCVGGAGVALVALDRRSAAATAMGVLLAVLGAVAARWRPGERDIERWLLPGWRYLRRAHRAPRMPGMSRLAVLAGLPVLAVLVLLLVQRPPQPPPSSPGEVAPGAGSVCIPLLAP